MPEVNFVWDPTEDNIVREYDDAGVVTAEYTTEPDLYGNVISQRRQGEYRQFHYDAQGSTLAATDENQNVTDTFAYDAFGEVTQRTGTSTIPFQYIGQKGYYWDSMGGQHAVRRRLYEATRASWLSADPLGIRYSDSNVYGYLCNLPLQSSDPSGMQREPGDRPPLPVNVGIASQKKIPCHRDCRSHRGSVCTFVFGISGNFTLGRLRPGASISLTMLPGYTDAPFPVPFPGQEEVHARACLTWMRACHSDIDRSYSRAGNFTIVLPTGVECRFDESVFPANEFSTIRWDRLPADCRDIITVRQDGEIADEFPFVWRTGVHYVTTREVLSIRARLSVRVGCGCAWVDPRRPGDEYRAMNWDSLELTGTIP